MGFVTTLRNRVARDLATTSDAARYASKAPNASILGTMLSPLVKYKPFGGSSLMSALNAVGYTANRVDTALGSIVRGNAKPGSVRYDLLTDTTHSTVPHKLVNGKLIPAKFGEAADYIKVVPRASLTASLATPVSLFTAGAAVNALTKSLKPEPEPPQQYYVNTTQQ